MTEDPDRLWTVSVNNRQREYIVSAPTPEDACMLAGDNWRTDGTVTVRQHNRGIYAISARLAKFGETHDQFIVSVTQEPA